MTGLVPTVILPATRYTIGGALTPLNRLATNRAAVRGPTLSTTQEAVPDTMRSPPVKACCWPLWGHHERPTHRYCGAAKDGAHAYCTRHAKQAHANAARPSLAGIPKP